MIASLVIAGHRRRWWLLPGAALLASGVACRPAPPAPQPTLRIAVHGTPLSLDPHARNEALTFSVLRNVYEGLTAFDAQMQVQPSLAETWENPDELTWRFHLRPGVRFHDGTPCTASDVAFSLDRARTLEGSGFSSYLTAVSEVRVVDDRTVDVVTASPYAILLNKLAFVMVVPEGSPAAIEHPVGTGPYRFVASDSSGVTLAAWDGSWTGGARVPEVRFEAVPSHGERARQLVAGTVDLADDLTHRDAAALEKAPGVRVVTRESLSVQYLLLDASVPPLDDRRVRQAIDLALDRRRLIAEMLGGFGQPAGQMTGVNVFGHEPALTATEVDLERSRALLAEAGHPDGFEVELATREGRDPEAVIAQLAAVGIRVRARVEPWDVLYERLLAGEVPFYFGGFLAPSADASDLFDSMVHSPDAVRGYGQNNFTRYANPALDVLIEQTGRTLGMLPRRQLLQRSMRLLMADLVFVPLVIPFEIYGARDDIAFEPRLDGFLFAAEIGRLPAPAGGEGAPPG